VGKKKRTNEYFKELRCPEGPFLTRRGRGEGYWARSLEGEGSPSRGSRGKSPSNNSPRKRMLPADSRMPGRKKKKFRKVGSSHRAKKNGVKKRKKAI